MKLLTLRQALRQMAVRPGMSALLVLILALGIGVNAAMFGLTDQVLFRPVPVQEPDTLVRVFTHDPDNSEYSNASHPWLRDMARWQESPFASVAAYSDWVTLPVAQHGGGMQMVSGAVAGGAFFETLGVPPTRGRLFGRETDAGVGQHAVVVVSDRYWREQLGADPEAPGRTVTIARQPYTVIGVLPAGFEGPSLGGRIDMWLPLSMAPVVMAGQLPPDILEERRFSWLDAVARLSPGVSLAAAHEATDAWSRRVEAEMTPEQRGEGRGPYARLMPLRDAAIDPYGTEGQARNAGLLVAIALVVLLIAGANAAGLLAVRNEERGRELSVRVSLGAGPRALLGQLALETLALVVAGALLGLLVGAAVAGIVVTLDPGGLALPQDAFASIMQPRVLALTAGCAALVMLLAGVAPARRAMQLDVVEGLRAGGMHGTADGGRQRWRALLVSMQLALTLVLLVGAALLLRSLWHTQRVDPGFDPADVVAATVSVARPGLEEVDQLRLFEAIRARVAALPGVQSAAWMVSPPVQSGGMRSTAETDVPGTAKGAEANADLNVVSPGALELLQVPLLKGRTLEAGDDGTRPVAVVNRAYAEKMFPGVDPIGRRIVSMSRESNGVEVVGVVADLRQRSLREPPQPQVYVPMSQFALSRLQLVVRTVDAAQAASVLGALPRTIAAVDPEVAVYRTRTLEDQIAQSMSQSRVFAWLLIGFAALAAVLAASGLYGTVSYWLRGRTRELGIRMALGATRQRIGALVLRQGARLLLLALPAGALLAWVATRALESLLFGVDPVDPATWLAAALLLVATAAAATWLPLRRAARLQPSQALRYE